jgi:hypothetical protein
MTTLAKQNILTRWTVDLVAKMPQIEGELTSPLLPGFVCVIDRFFEL